LGFLVNISSAFSENLRSVYLGEVFEACLGEFAGFFEGSGDFDVVFFFSSKSD